MKDTPQPLDQQLPGMVWLVDEQLRVQRLGGSAWSADVDRAEAVGQELARFFDCADDAPFVAAHRKALSGPTLESTVSWRGRTLRCRVGPWQDSTGNVVGALGHSLGVSDPAMTSELPGAPLEVIFEHAYTQMALLDRTFTFVKVNRRYVEGTALSPGELLGRKHFDLFPNAEAEAIFTEVRETGRAYQVQARAFEHPAHPEWGVTYWDWSLVPIPDEQGVTRYLLLALYDVTALKRAEQQVRQLNETLENRVRERTAELVEERNFSQTVFDTQETLVVVLDPDGRIERLNPACERLSGYTVAELLGRHLCDALLPPDEADGVRRLLARPAEGGTAGRRENHWVSRDGHRVPVVWSESAIRDDDGSVRHVIVTGIDVTQRKRTELELAAARERLTYLLSSAPAVLYAATSKGATFISDNIQQLLGYDTRELLEDPVFLRNRIHPEDLPRVETELRKLAPGQTISNRYRLRAADGSYRWLRDHCRMALDPENPVAEVVGLWQDETPLVVAEQEVERMRGQVASQQKMATLGQLTATVSHELRNPLGTIRTSASSLKHRLPAGDGAVGKALERIDRNVGRCDKIITDLLDFSRSGRSQPEATPVDTWLAELIAELESPDWLAVELDLGVGELEMRLDRDRLRRAVINVFDNAVQAMQAGSTEESQGTLRVHTGVADGRLVVTFADSGPGMTPETLERIFEPLFSTKTYGLGLGMATVKHVMEQEGGGIDVTSRPGEGTEVRLWLRLAGRIPGAA